MVQKFFRITNKFDILNNILYRKHKVSIQHFSSNLDLRDEVP